MWYSRVIADKSFQELGNAMAYFDKEYAEAQGELKMKGKQLKKMSMEIAALMEYRFGQLQEIEAIRGWLERRYNKEKIDKQRYYMESYNRSLTERVAEKYAEVDDDVVVYADLVAEVQLMKDKFESLTKGLEFMHFQLTNLTKIYVAGIEDAIL